VPSGVDLSSVAYALVVDKWEGGGGHGVGRGSKGNKRDQQKIDNEDEARPTNRRKTAHTTRQRDKTRLKDKIGWVRENTRSFFHCTL
jgi:hypothetical protein